MKVLIINKIECQTTSKETKVVDIAHILAKEKIGAIVILEKEKVIVPEKKPINWKEPK